MVAAETIKYRGKELMPEPRCHKCSLGIPLDTLTYWNYNGPVRCPNCGCDIHMAFSNGTLLAAKPVLDEKLLIVEGHTIPEQPLGDYEEAVWCLTVSAWKAAAVMTRRAVQGALLAKGAPDDSPTRMIEWAANHGLLNQRQKNLSVTVTFFGNKGGHPEEDTEVNLVGELEATQALRVTKVLLLALFLPTSPRPV